MWVLFFRKKRDILRRIKPQKTEMVDILLSQSLSTCNKRPSATNKKCNWFLFYVLWKHYIIYIYIFYFNIYKNVVFFCLSSSQHYTSLKIPKKKSQQKAKKKKALVEKNFVYYIISVFHFTLIYIILVWILQLHVSRSNTFSYCAMTIYIPFILFKIKWSLIWNL